MSHRNAARQRALERYALPEATPGATLDRILGLAAQMVGAPVAALEFWEGAQCRVEAARGLDAEDVPAASSFAAQVIEAEEGRVLRDPEEPLAEGEAAALDAPPRVYAGVPLVVEDAPLFRDPVAIGALCVLGEALSMPDDEALEALEAFAAIAVDVLVQQEHDRSFQLLFTHNPDPMWVYDRETLRFLAVNEAAVAHYGYTRNEFLSMHITDIPPVDEVDELVDYLGRTPSSFRHSGHWRHQRADGSVIDVDVTSSDLEFEGRDATLVAVRDVTEQRAAQAAVHRRERYLSVMLDSIGDAVIATDVAGCVAGMNPVAEHLTGWAEDEARGRPLDEVFRIINAQTGAPADNPVDTVLAEGRTVGLANHTALVARDGTRRQIADSAAPIRADDGELLGVVMVFRDVTETYERREALRQSEERYRTLVERSHDAIYIYRGNRLLFANERTCALTGYTEDELLDLDVFELVHPDDRARVRRFARQRIGGTAPSRYEARLLRSDGTVRYGEFSVQPITYRGAYAVIGSIRDVTERRTIESTLRRRENKVQALYEAMGALTLSQTAALVAERLQALIIDTLGYPISVVRYLDGDALVPVTVSEEVRRRMPARPEYEADGVAAVARAFRAGETAIYDDVRMVEGVHAPGAVRAVAYVPIGPYGILSVGSTEVGGIDPFDVTLIEILARNAESVIERIEREEVLREARDAATEMSRLKSAFLANMSHEIRTPLTSVIGFAEVLGEQELGEANTLIRLIRRGGQRLLDTLNSVLDLSQLEAGSMEMHPERIDVATEVRDTVGLFSPQAREKGVTLAVEGAAEPVHLHLDAAALRRILSNLLSNAVKFTPGGGRVEVRLHATRDDVAIEVEDTGIGIDEAFFPELFEAFKQESTGNARAFEGSGLGLAITHQLVELMGGEIEVASEKEEGTCFTVRFPQNWRADERESG